MLVFADTNVSGLIITIMTINEPDLISAGCLFRERIFFDNFLDDAREKGDLQSSSSETLTC